MIAIYKVNHYFQSGDLKYYKLSQTWIRIFKFKKCICAKVCQVPTAEAEMACAPYHPNCKCADILVDRGRGA